VLLLVAAALVLVWIVDANAFKPRIEAAVREATGRELALVGDIELGFFPWLSLRAGEGRFGNAPGFGDEPLASWKGAQLGAKLFPLLRGELVASRVKLDGADVRLRRRADGTANWEGIGADASRESSQDRKTEPMPLRIDGVELTNSRLSFVDETVPRHVRIESMNLATDEIAEGEPFTDTKVAGVLHLDGFAPAGVAFRVDVPDATVAWDLSALEVDEFEIAFGGLEIEGGVQGSLAEPSRLSGTLVTNEFDPRALLASTGIDAPKTTDPDALGKLKLDATWQLEAGAVRVDPFALTLDDTQFTGNFRRGAGADAIGEFALRGDSLHIARYIPPADPASEPFVLPTATLKALKFRGQVDLDQATLDDIAMKGVTLRLLLDEQGLRGEKRTSVQKP
jgi:AsmA protein